MNNTNKTKLIKQLANEFSSELLSIPVTVLPNEDIVYNDYLIKNSQHGFWELYNISNSFFIAKFYLKSCALIAAKFYQEHHFMTYREVKWLDREYNKNKNDSIMFKHCLKTTNDFDQKVIFLNRLECSEEQADLYKVAISRLFKRTFV